VEIRSQVFALGFQTKRRDTTKSHRGYISPIVGVADVINHTKFCNEGVQSYEGSNFALLI